MGGMGRQFDGGYAEYTCVPAGQVQVSFVSYANDDWLNTVLRLVLCLGVPQNFPHACRGRHNSFPQALYELSCSLCHRCLGRICNKLCEQLDNAVS